MPEWGYCGMPLVDGKQVILVPGGKQGDLVALDKKDRRIDLAEQGLTDSIHYSSPIVAEIGGVRQYIQLTDASVAGIAAADGRLLWRAPAERQRRPSFPRRSTQNDYVYVTSGYGVGCNLFKITAGRRKIHGRTRSMPTK